MNGTLIVIDGLDGSGKQTQARLLRERLERERVPVRAPPSRPWHVCG